MSKPTKHYGKWRIRWVDEHGLRQSAVFDEFKTALLVLRQNELEADERRRGLRGPAPTERTVDDIAEYWERERSPLKKSADDDKSILKQLRAAFGKTKLADFAGLIMAVDRYQATKAHLSVKTIANHLTLLGSLLGLAHDLGWMPRVPKIKKPKVRLISQDFIRAEESETVSEFDDLSLVQLIVERGAEAVKALPEAIRKKEKATAETIENNVRKLIIDESPINPKYYEKMSELLSE